MKKQDDSKKGMLTNEELSSYLSDLSISPYKSDFQRWWRVLYCSHYATGGLGLPAFMQWCETDADLAKKRDTIQENWEDLTEVNPIYDVDYLARELAAQGKMRLQERLAMSHPVKLNSKLRKLIQDINSQQEIGHAITAMAELGSMSQLQIYETFQRIKKRTSIPLKVLEDMYELELHRVLSQNTAWPNVLTNRHGKVRPKATINNFRYFCTTRNIRITLNQMTQEIEIHHDNEVIDEIYLRDLMGEAGLSGYGRELIVVMRVVAKDSQPHHPVRDWLGAEKWDGVDRIELLGAKLDTPRCPPDLLRIYLTRWMLGGIEAIYNHKYGVDKQSMLVLHGPPGCGKTTFFEQLIPDAFRYQWFAQNIREPWTAQENAISRKTWLTEIVRLDELLLYGYGIKGRARTLADMSAHLDAQCDKAIQTVFVRRTFFGAGITTYNERLPFAADRHYFVVPVGEVDIRTELDIKQVWLQIKKYYDDGQRHTLLKSELTKHMRYAGIVSTRPRWPLEKRGFVNAAK